MMTEDEIRERMDEISEREDDSGGDYEITHSMADDLLCEILFAAGFEPVVAWFNKLHKWYV